MNRLRTSMIYNSFFIPSFLLSNVFFAYQSVQKFDFWLSCTNRWCISFQAFFCNTLTTERHSKTERTQVIDFITLIDMTHIQLKVPSYYLMERSTRSHKWLHKFHSLPTCVLREGLQLLRDMILWTHSYVSITPSIFQKSFMMFHNLNVQTSDTISE